MDERMKEQIKETVDYMKSMNDYARQEIARYVRGVYDGSQSVKRQYGLLPESVLAQGGKATRLTTVDGKPAA